MTSDITELKNIFDNTPLLEGNDGFDPQNIFNSIEWQLSAVDQRLFVSQNSLTVEQRRVLDTCAKQKYLEGPEYSSSYTLRPPEQLNPVQAAMWDAALPAAEERLYAALQPLVELPWQTTPTSDDNYFIWISGINAEQKALIESAPEDAIKDQSSGTILIGFRHDDTLYMLERGGRRNGANRLHELVDNRIKVEIERDKHIIATLPWEFDKKGNLILDSGIVDSLPEEFELIGQEIKQLPPGEHTESAPQQIQLPRGKTEVEELLKRRGIKLDGTNYVLVVPNTVGKLWDRPDGETNTARRAFYEQAHDAVLAGNEPIMELPWRFDQARWAFVVVAGDLKARQSEIVDGALVKSGTVYELHDLADYAWRAAGPRAQVEQFRGQLEKVVPDDIAIADLAELPWEYGHNELKVAQADFRKSRFARERKKKRSLGAALVAAVQTQKVLGFELDWEGKAVIKRDNLDELPYYTAVKRGLENRYKQYVVEHADKIRALPWVFGLRDDIKSYAAAKLYVEDLAALQRVKAYELVKLNQLENRVDREFFIVSDHIFDLLQPQFEAWKPQIIATVAEMPWEHNYGGVRLIIPASKLSADDRKILDRIGIREDGHGSYATSSGREGKGYNSTGDEILNVLRYAIATKIRERTQLTEVTPEIISLPWQYGGRPHGRNIVLDYSKITVEQEAQLKAAIPEIHYMDRMSLFRHDLISDMLPGNRCGYFELVASGDYYIAHSVIDAPYYSALLPVAEKHFLQLAAEVAQFPWRATAEGGYEVSQRDLTEAQQDQIQQTPGDCFNREAEFAKMDKYGGTKVFVLDPNASDQRLIEAVRLASSRPPLEIAMPTAADHLIRAFRQSGIQAHLFRQTKTVEGDKLQERITIASRPTEDTPDEKVWDERRFMGSPEYSTYRDALNEIVMSAAKECGVVDAHMNSDTPRITVKDHNNPAFLVLATRVKSVEFQAQMRAVRAKYNLPYTP